MGVNDFEDEELYGVCIDLEQNGEIRADLQKEVGINEFTISTYRAKAKNGKNRTQNWKKRRGD